MIHAAVIAESIVAPTLFRPAFLHSLDPKRTLGALRPPPIYGVILPLLWPKPNIQPGPDFRGQVRPPVPWQSALRAADQSRSNRRRR